MFLEQLNEHGVSTAVHWRPLHLHPYYQETFGWKPEDFPVASREWLRLITLPLFPGMTEQEQEHVVGCVRGLCVTHARSDRRLFSSPLPLGERGWG